MQNQNHTSLDDKFTMNFGSFDSDNIFNTTHMGNMGVGMKRSAHEAGLDREPMGLSSDDDSDFMKKEGGLNASSSTRENMMHQQTSLEQPPQKPNLLPNGKKTKGRVKIKMEFIDNKLRRYTTFSKRKTGIMKKAYELSTLTGTQVMLLVASETGHVYTFATRKLQPMITSEAGKALIQTCLNSPDPPSSHQYHHHDQRMSATGYEETELTYAVPDDDNTKACGGGGGGPPEDYTLGASSSPSECSSFPTSPTASPPPAPVPSGGEARKRDLKSCSSSAPTVTVQLPHGLVITPTLQHNVPAGGVVVGSAGGSVVYAAGGGLVYAPPTASSGGDGGPGAPLLLPLQLHQGCDDDGSSVMADQSDGNSFACTSRHHSNNDNDLVKLINTSNIIRNLTNNDFTISNNTTKSGILNSNSGRSSSGDHISLCGGNSHIGSTIEGNGNTGNIHGDVGNIGNIHGNVGNAGIIHGNVGNTGNLHGNVGNTGNIHGNISSVIQGSSQLHAAVYTGEGRRPASEAGGGGSAGVFCLTGIRTSSPPALHLLNSVGDLSSHLPGRVIHRQQHDIIPDDEDELDEDDDEEEEEGEENNEEECVQQAFPTDLSLNARDKKS